MQQQQQQQQQQEIRNKKQQTTRSLNRTSCSIRIPCFGLVNFRPRHGASRRHSWYVGLTQVPWFGRVAAVGFSLQPDIQSRVDV